jgi:hypothetical protein
MGIFESTGLLFLGILKRLYWLIPSLLSDPFDISERWLKVTYEAPQWAFWLLLSLGLSIAIILTYHELRVKVVKLEKQLDDRDKKKAERETLAVFLNEGQSLKCQCENEKEPAPEVKTTEWAEKIENWLETEFDTSYVSRFRNTADVPMKANSIFSIPHRNLWAYIHTRLYQLGKFIEQLGD